MRIFSLLALLGAASIASAAVTVTFPEAERYIDAGNPWETDRTVAELTRHLERLGERHLSPSQNLKIEVLDVDLAGQTRYFFRRGLSEIRVLKGRADWPSMKLRYTLEAGGTVSVSAEETVADMSYLMTPAPGGSSKSLYYEKRMLDTWFRQRFVEGRKPAP